MIILYILGTIESYIKRSCLIVYPEQIRWLKMRRYRQPHKACLQYEKQATIWKLGKNKFS
jgi:hypothetical protein